MRHESHRNQADIQEQWWRSPGFLYFVGAGDPIIAVRIALCAKTAFTRKFRKMQRYNHEPLKVLGVIPFTDGKYPMKECEVAKNRTHTKFSQAQLGASGTSKEDWFQPSEDLLSFIRENAEAYTNV